MYGYSSFCTTKQTFPNEVYEFGPQIIEKPVKITDLYVYPIRGIKGIKVDNLELNQNRTGFKYDRMFVILKKGEKIAVALSHMKFDKLTELKQEFVDDGSKVRLSHGEEHIDLDITRPPTGQIYQDTTTNYKVRGYIMPSEVNQWLQDYFNDENIFMLRAIPNLDRDPKPEGTLPGDKISSFVTVAHLHIVNESSV